MKRKAVISRPGLLPLFSRRKSDEQGACIRQAMVCPGARAELPAGSRQASTAFPAKPAFHSWMTFPIAKQAFCRWIAFPTTKQAFRRWIAFPMVKPVFRRKIASPLQPSLQSGKTFPTQAVSASCAAFLRGKAIPVRSLFLLVTVFLALPLFLAGCTTEEIPERPDIPERMVRVMFSPNGLGDLSYSDDILRGVLAAKESTGTFQLQYHSPAGPEEAEALLRKWMEEDTDPQRYYTILAANEFEEVAQRLLAGTGRTNYLLLDPFSAQLQLPCLRFSGYGSSFLAGLVAYALTGADTVAYLGGRRGDYYIRECYDGFRDGYRQAGGREVAETYVSDEAYGFAMPRRAYLMADSLFRLYPFVYAIAGGSNNGVYQYLREHPASGGYTAGVDVDQSAYSDRIVGSAIKQIGLCVGDYIRRWLAGEELPLYTHCGLQSGYTFFQVAESYRPTLEKIVHDNFERAAAQETEYEHTRR